MKTSARLSPIWSDVRSERHSVRNDRPSRIWCKFLTFWMVVIFVFLAVYFGGKKFMAIGSHTVEVLTGYFHEFLPHFVLVCIFLLSSLVLVCYSSCSHKSTNTIRNSPSKLKLTEAGSGISTAGKSESNMQLTAKRSRDFPCRRTFSGTGTDVWHEFRRYFQNLAILNNWSKEESRRTLLCSLRGQAEAFAYGLHPCEQNDCDLLFSKMEQRFGIINMKDSYLADARLRRKQKNETYREFGQSIEDLHRKAYPDCAEIVGELSLSIFLDNCHESADFRLAVKRTRPKCLQDAVIAAIQEESLRQSEHQKPRNDYRSGRVYQMNGRYGRGRGYSRRGRGRWYGSRSSGNYGSLEQKDVKDNSEN